MNIKAILGLGNPGSKYINTRHNIGFRIIDGLAEHYNGVWRQRDNMLIAEIDIEGKEVILIKPQTYMNSSGDVIPYLQYKDMVEDDILVIHDELELPFGTIQFKTGGSARGHNGLKSIIEKLGKGFHRIRCGIGRPSNSEDVPDYVLQNFHEKPIDVDKMIQRALETVVDIFEEE